MKVSTRQKLLLLSFVMFAGNGLLGFLVYKNHEKLFESQQWVDHTHEVINLSDKILSLNKDIETSSRGFILTDDSEFLELLYPAKQVIFADLRQLKELTRDNPEQQPRIDSLVRYTGIRLEFALQAIALRRSKGLAAAITLIASKQGKHFSDTIRQLTQSIQRAEVNLLKTRKHVNERSAATFNRLSMIMFIVMTCFIALLLAASANNLIQREDKEKKAKALMRANQELAFQNNEKAKRASELIIANTELAFQNDEKKNRAFELGIINKDLKIADEKIIRFSNLNAFIGQVNQNIVRIKDEAALFHNACNIAVSYGKLKMAWIGLFDNADKTISLVDHCGIPEEEILKFTKISYRKDGPQQHVLSGESFYKGNGTESNVDIASWSQFASKHGIHSSIVLPIKKLGNVIGTFNLYALDIAFTEQGEIKLLVEVAKDISFAIDLFAKTKQHAETDLLVVHNEKRFRALIEKSKDMISLRRPDGKILYVSSSVTTVLGYTPEEVLQKTISNLIHPEDIPGLLEQTQLLLETPGGSYSRQQRYLHKNGTWIWGEGTVTNMLHEPGIHALVSNFRDISERKLSEQQLAFNENNLKALINNTQDLMWSVDRDFKLITSNHAFEKMVKDFSGFTPVKGMNILDGNDDDQTQRFKINYDRAFAGEIFTEVEHNTFPVNSWSEISYYPIHKDDSIVGTACFSRNITKQKEAENEIRELNSELEEKVVQRTQQLEAVNKELESFSYSVSHDLRAPLRIINGYSQILLDDYATQLGEHGQETLSVIVSNAGRMGQLIDDLLSFSHLGRTGLNKSLTDMNHLVQEVLDELRTSGISIPTEFNVDNLAPVSVDPGLLKQVWMNLISNAIKYSSNCNQPTIQVGNNKAEPGWNVYFVKDNGAGFDMKYYAKLFGVFQRLHSQEEFAGTGVGLALVQRIIIRHGGKVWADAKPDEGATFYFSLPAVKVPEGELAV